MNNSCTRTFAALLGLLVFPALKASASPDSTTTPSTVEATHYRHVDVDGTDLFYREAGPENGPVVLLLHGFPTSSQMFRELIPRLSDKYHVLAPDYPGYGYSAMPDRRTFAYTFAHMTDLVDGFAQKMGLDHYALYVMDYGAPIGYRLALKHPERVTAFIVQNGNAYKEGLAAFWDPIKAYWKTGADEQRQALNWLTKLKATNWQYTNAAKDLSLVDPDAWTVDQARMDRPGNADIQLDMLYDYRTNVPLYPSFQAYFREHSPPMLITWGKNDDIFPPVGASPYKRDLPNVEIHLLDAGHFALETHGEEIARLMRDFLDRSLKPSDPRSSER